MLILGGTAEAREIAELLASQPYLRPVYSLAGRTSSPRLPKLPPDQLRRGGFGGAQALASYLINHRVAAVLDATHPFAAQISFHAASAAAQANIPIARFARPAWTPAPGHPWLCVADVDGAIDALCASDARAARVLLTHGTKQIDGFARCRGQRLWLRAVDRPVSALPPNMQLILDRGPFDLEAETRLMRDLAIDTLVTKNSGGDRGATKLRAANALGVQVIMVERPSLPAPSIQIDSVQSALAWALSLTAKPTVQPPVA
ncbi:MAG: cobalt-precorrin-6A reductase [Pseudomonadota bacterium]